MSGGWGTPAMWSPPCPGCPFSTTTSCHNCQLAREGESMHLSKRCPHCGGYAEVTVPMRAWEEWANGSGVLLREVWPEASLDELDIALTGTHPECYVRAFGERTPSTNPVTQPREA